MKSNYKFVLKSPSGTDEIPFHGTQYDSQSTFELKHKKGHEEEINFLCTDELGQIKVKPEMRICDVCGANIGNGIGFEHGSYMYCENCEKIHRKNEIKDILNKRINNKKRTVKNENRNGSVPHGF